MMAFELWLAWATALGIGLLLLVTPALSRGNTFFAVTVPDGFPASALGRGIQRRYRIVTLASSLLALVLIAPLGLLLAHNAAALAAFLIAGLLPVAGALTGFVYCRSIALEHSQDHESSREVTLERDRLIDLVPKPLWLHAVPYLALAAAAAWLAWQWSAIPDSVVMRVGGESGAITQPRSLLTVFGLPLMMTLTSALCHAIMGLGLIIRRLPGHRGRVRSINLFLLGVIWAMAFMGAYDSLVVLYGERWITGPVGITVHLVAVAVILLLPIWLLVTGQFARPGQPAQGDRSPDTCWKLGLIYFNPDDPALWVEKRFGIGYTVNLARPSAWIVIGSILAVTAAIVIWSFSAGY